MQVIAKFLGLLYSYLNISISKNIVPDEIKGREIHHSFPMTLFMVNEFSSPILVVLIKLTIEIAYFLWDENNRKIPCYDKDLLAI